MAGNMVAFWGDEVNVNAPVTVTPPEGFVLCVQMVRATLD
jgi:hypothetical protein